MDKCSTSVLARLFLIFFYKIKRFCFRETAASEKKIISISKNRESAYRSGKRLSFWTSGNLLVDAVVGVVAVGVCVVGVVAVGVSVDVVVVAFRLIFRRYIVFSQDEIFVVNPVDADGPSDIVLKLFNVFKPLSGAPL